MLARGWAHRAAYGVPPPLPADYDHRDVAAIARVRRHTMTSAARLEALIPAVEYVAEAEIDGAIVECGVWKGGSIMAVALTLNRLGIADRDLYLFDTFSGMTPPTAEDL